MAHTYWRVLFAQSGSTGGSEVALSECYMFDASGASLTTGGTASASSSFSGLPASQAFDNDTSTAWNCGGSALSSAAQWLQYQFGSAVDVSSITLVPWSATTAKSPTNFKVQFSDTGSSWTDATSSFTPTWPTKAGMPLAFAVATPTAGFYVNWRANVTAVQGGATTPSCAELELRATGGGSSLATTANGIATEGTEFGSTNTAAKAFDANSSTFWNSNINPPDWIGFAFNQPRQIVEVVWQARPDSFYTQSPSAFTLQGSNDGTWATVGTFSPATWTTASQTQTFDVTTTLSPATITSAEVFGTLTLNPTVSLSPTGIGSGETFGSTTIFSNVPHLHRVRQSHLSAPIHAGLPVPSANRILVGTGNQLVSVSSIGSAAAFGSITISTNITRSMTAIASAEAFGTVTIRRHPGLLRFLIATDNA
jgi:hypothetical protein